MPNNRDSPSPGIAALTIFPLLNLTLAVFRCPEFGFFGFVTPTFRHTPFIAGRPTSAGDEERGSRFGRRPFLHNWFRVTGRAGVVEKKEMKMVLVLVGWRRRLCRRKWWWWRMVDGNWDGVWLAWRARARRARMAGRESFGGILCIEIWWFGLGLMKCRSIDIVDEALTMRIRVT
jgi:hypothetical protein